MQRLKIRDDVDLKELEKFGFNPCYYMGDKVYEKKFERGLFYKEYILVWFNDREIQICKNGQALLGTLYDLFKAGLVEKVKE